ncbi:MAG: hypothetical protein JKY34_03835 [Kordiimonadaceae bacterium]|nr:hypothetical protein [Kordiimonadaceae bacterium]
MKQFLAGAVGSVIVLSAIYALSPYQLTQTNVGENIEKYKSNIRTYKLKAPFYDGIYRHGTNTLSFSYEALAFELELADIKNICVSGAKSFRGNTSLEISIRLWPEVQQKLLDILPETEEKLLYITHSMQPVSKFTVTPESWQNYKEKIQSKSDDPDIILSAEQSKIHNLLRLSAEYTEGKVIEACTPDVNLYQIDNWEALTAAIWRQ